jgi:hypothetical protein
MKKLLLSASVVAGLFAAQPTVDSLQKQIDQLQQQLKDLKNKQAEQNDRYYKKVAPIVANNHLFWSYDLRTTFDAISEHTTGGPAYTVAPSQIPGAVDITVPLTNGMPSSMQTKRDYGNQIFTNRVILTGVYKPSDALKATVRIEANNIFGANAEESYSPYQNVPWVANETPDDTNIRLKEAFFNWFFGDDLMFSAGRRPATNGYPANLRENDDPNSPLAHLINMEFDGFSFKVGNGEFSKLSDKFGDWGTWLKFCAGRGYSTSSGKWPYNFAPSYSSTDENDGLKNMDFAGFIFVPYDDGQYSLWTETVWAWHVQGYRLLNAAANLDQTYSGDVTYTYGMADFGGYFGENVILKADGIGDGISDFLDDTKAFVSFAMSKTQGVKNLQIGVDQNFQPIYAEGHTGRSIWIGADMPAGDNGRLGVNYVRGSKYWRSFTYGEDTLVGSIAAVRGKAYEVYYNRQIIPHLTAGLRFTLLKYDHAGSDGFFGMMMDPDYADQFGYVKTAKDLRAYIRYNF